MEMARKIDLIKIGSETAFKSYSSSVSSLNSLFGDPLYCSNLPLGIYGKPQIGKSLFLNQEAYSFAALGLNSLYIDTEGGTGKMMEMWRDRFIKRFGEPKGDICYQAAMSFEKIMLYMGYKADVIFKQADKKSDKGRMELRVFESKTVEESPIYKDVKDNKISMVFLDSLSAPIKMAIPDAEQNNPTKASATALLLGRLIDIQDFLGVPVVVTAHASWNPARAAQSTSADARGGNAFHHACKRKIYMDGREGKDWTNYRRVWLVRGETEPELGAMAVLKYSDNGVDDAEMELKDSLTKGEIEDGKGGYKA